MADLYVGKFTALRARERSHGLRAKGFCSFGHLWGNEKVGEADTAGVLEEILTVDTCVRQRTSQRNTVVAWR